MLNNLQTLEALALPIQKRMASPLEPAALEAFGLPQVSDPKPQPRSPLADFIYQVLDHITRDATDLGFVRTTSRVCRLHQHVTKNVTLINEYLDPDLMYEIKYLREAMEDDLKDRIVFFPEQSKVQFYGRPKLFGDATFDAFEHLRKDIIAAGNCYATDNHTACVFHLMRIIEQAVRMLARRFRVKVKRPLDYEDWKAIAKGLNIKLENLRNSTRGAKREKELAFYNDAADRCQFFKELWRDNVMHSRTNYEEHQATDIFFRVRGFVELLAARKRKRKIGTP
jgi:hypothetical protein